MKKGDFSGTHMENKDKMSHDKVAFATFIIQRALKPNNLINFSTFYSLFYGYVGE